MVLGFVGCQKIETPKVFCSVDSCFRPTLACANKYFHIWTEKTLIYNKMILPHLEAGSYGAICGIQFSCTTPLSSKQ